MGLIAGRQGIEADKLLHRKAGGVDGFSPRFQSEELLPREVMEPLLISGSMNWFLLNETFPVDLPLYQPGFVWVIPIKTGTLDEEVRKLEERKRRQQMQNLTRKGS